jgi:nucleoside-diphosphate-sugar epimerase
MRAVKCLITGASGFTGGHLALSLAGDGHQVRALVRPGSKDEHLNHPNIEIVTGQLTDSKDVAAAAAGCEKIFHIAAVFRTAGHPDSHYYDVNVGGTENVLAAARHAGCERTVHCSTGGVHGHIEEPPASETYRFKPDDVYQRSKVAAENAVRSAMRQGQRAVIFRPGAIYGEGDLRLLKLFRSIARKRFLMIGPGTPRLHLVHVDDLVAGIRLCGTTDVALGEAFLLAGPEAPTLNEIVQHATDVLQVPVPRARIPVWPVYGAACLCEALCVPLRINPPLYRRRVGFFTHHREFDTSKARKMLGFVPRITPRDGIARTIRWYSANGYLS